MISKSLGILLMGAFLGTWSPAQAAQNPGFEPEGLVLAHLRFGPNHPTSEKNRVYRSLAEAIAELPRVDGVAWVQSIPFGPHLRLLFEVPDRSSQEFLEDQQFPFLFPASPGYFQTLGLRATQGRLFGPADHSGSDRVAILNESLALAIWPGQSPLGKCVKAILPVSSQGSMDAERAPCRTVIGVVPDTRIRSLKMGEDPTPFQYYIPFEQTDFLPGEHELEVWGLLIRTPLSRTQIETTLFAVTAEHASRALALEVRPYSEVIQERNAGGTPGSGTAQRRRRPPE